MKDKIMQLLRRFVRERRQQSTVDTEVGVKHFRLTKYDGDPPRPGEDKAPVEIIQGGDGLPTRVWRRINGKLQEVSHAQS